MKLLTLFALWGVTFLTMTPNVTQSISSRFSVASLFFSWDSRMSFLLAIFLSISAEDTRGFLDPVKAGKRQHIHWHKWTIKTNSTFLGRLHLAAKHLCVLLHPEVTWNKTPRIRKLLVTLVFVQIATLQLSPKPALSLLISDWPRMADWAGNTARVLVGTPWGFGVLLWPHWV